ncbi:hypothetical protein ACFQRC_04925 [Enterovirga sp. GCM10030262]|uniref:hypothetical protein n=1 Tax=Enterovirga sp. GCM10030262 TaxID=3273391 RepID=UPI003617A882
MESDLARDILGLSKGALPVLAYLVVLTSLSRCISSDLCPSDEELLSAIRARDVAIASDPQAREEASEHSITVDRLLPSSITNVFCGQARTLGRREVSCSYTLRYPDETIYEGEIFEWDDERWVIPNAVEAARNIESIKVR